MKDYLERVKKYEEKIKENIINEEQRKMMVENYAQSAQILSLIDELVNKILNGDGILIGKQRVFYYAFARELLRIKNRYSGKVAKNEIKIIFDKWRKRRLKKKVLLKIKKSIEGLLSPQ
jgi:hypothetical protein